MNKLNRIMAYISALLIVAILVLTTAQIILRQFNIAIASLHEISGYLLLASLFFGLAFTFSENKHIRVSLLLELPNPKIVFALDLLSHVLAFLLALFMCFACYALVYDSFTFNEMSKGELVFPIWLVQIPMLIGSIALSLSLGHKTKELMYA